MLFIVGLVIVSIAGVVIPRMGAPGAYDLNLVQAIMTDDGAPPPNPDPDPEPEARWPAAVGNRPALAGFTA